MSNFVYWKGLRLVANALRRYITRNQLQLQANLTTDQYECVVALLEAVLTCLSSLPVDSPVEQTSPAYSGMIKYLTY